jgi:TRAP-type mannitol/chloroaromatic compound transport system permease small subunit
MFFLNFGSFYRFGIVQYLEDSAWFTDAIWTIYGQVVFLLNEAYKIKHQ